MGRRQGCGRASGGVRRNKDRKGYKMPALRTTLERFPVRREWTLLGLMEGRPHTDTCSSQTKGLQQSTPHDLGCEEGQIHVSV